jgi:hypothetical protein
MSASKVQAHWLDRRWGTSSGVRWQGRQTFPQMSQMKQIGFDQALRAWNGSQQLCLICDICGKALLFFTSCSCRLRVLRALRGELFFSVPAVEEVC